MIRKLVCAAAVIAVLVGVLALASTPVNARGCKPDPNPNGKDGCSIHCPPCTVVVCTPGGRCPYGCEPIPDCVPPGS